MIVRVPDVSVDLYFAQLEQLDQAISSLWIVWAQTGKPLPISGPDAAIAEDILSRYQPARRAAAEQAANAKAKGEDVFDLELDLPAEASDDLLRLVALLDQVDELCEDEVLGWAASPKIRTFRRWMIGQLAEQVRSASS